MSNKGLPCSDLLYHEVAPRLAQVKYEMSHIEAAIRTCLSSYRGQDGQEPVISFKDSSVLLSVLTHQCHEILISIIMWLISDCHIPVCITCWFRRGDQGVHGTIPVRGVDLRSRTLGDPKAVAAMVNDAWVYAGNDDSDLHRVCLYHRSMSCPKCGVRWEVDPDLPVPIPEGENVRLCPHCNIPGIDHGPHFHMQARDDTRRRVTNGH